MNYEFPDLSTRTAVVGDGGCQCAPQTRHRCNLDTVRPPFWRPFPVARESGFDRVRAI